MEDGQSMGNYCFRLNSMKWLIFDCFDLYF